MAEWRDLSRLGWSAVAMLQGDRIVGVHLLKTREGAVTPSIESLRANGFLRKPNGDWVTGRVDIRWNSIFPTLHNLFDRVRKTPAAASVIAATMAVRGDARQEAEGGGRDIVYGATTDQSPADFNARARQRLIGTSIDAESDANVLAERILDALPEDQRVEATDLALDWAVVIRAAMGGADVIVVSDVAGRTFVPRFTLARSDLIESGEVSAERHPDSDAFAARVAMQKTLLDRTTMIRGALIQNGWERSESVTGALEKSLSDGRRYRVGFDLTMAREERSSPPDDATNFTFMIDIVSADGVAEALADLPHGFDESLGALVERVNAATPMIESVRAAEIENVRSLIQATGHAPYEADILQAIVTAGGYAPWSQDRVNQDVADSLMNERLLRIRHAFYRLNESQQLSDGWQRRESDPSMVEFGVGAGRYRVSVDIGSSAVTYNITNFALKLLQVEQQDSGSDKWKAVATIENDLQRDADAVVSDVWRTVLACEQRRTRDADSAASDRTQSRTARSAASVDRIEDVGEKIGGARKDKYQGFGDFRFQDFTLKGDEINALFDYKKTWPFSVTAIREAGGDALAAAELKALRARLKTPTEVLRYADLTVKEYVGAVERLHGHFGEVKTHDEFVAAVRKLHEWLESDEAWEPSGVGRRRATRDYMALDTLVGGAARNLRLTRLSWESELHRLAVLQRPYRFTDDKGRPRNDEAAWKWLVPTRVAPTREVKEGEPTTPTDRDLVSAKYAREGIDWRDGRDIAAEELLNEFGFRGIEFGNWVNQRERQEVVNAAFDAFCDMADVLAIDRRQIGFDGKLGLAFGARGRGKFAAHFEPGLNVINLTKTSGAGWLAHEWGHAFDRLAGQAKKSYASEHSLSFSGMSNGNWLAQKADLADADEETLARYQATTEAKLRHSENVVVSWVSGLIDRRARILTGAAHWGNARDRAKQIYLDALAAADEFRDVSNEDERERAFTGAIDSFIKLEVPLTDANLKKADAANVRDLKKREREAWTNIHLAFASRERHLPQHKLYSMTRDEILVELSRARETLASMLGARWPADERQRAIDATRYVLRQHNINSIDIPTAFMTEAATLDAGRSKKYWSTSWEMFARAFEAYVYDALEAQGGANSYLVSEQKADGYFASAHWKANPYPAGDERRELNAYMHSYLTEATQRLGMRRDNEADAVASPQRQALSL
ncbi:LPD1 domain-containing protein [Burkholderia cepacia]|uniref:Large polyvalent protein-associated domain-containing protein n=3 Tax=Burkholderia cepacia TaxID=292 RepID=A0AAX2RQG0_BURCE|nr:LPD1 domain-containing protein [Burkholderia cepacia]TET01629.1 hypothetical protein E3D36_16470 [Burkholderia cepacia]TEU47487.1 hypothetical protein E3D37_15900 [Burkholderia cepacia]TEU53514.1 hypothetical protein E3D38_12290 [Burkholderia cepacia]TEV02120.1 hypothetical protein E3D40_13220 [Burkholderia cepacia]TEV07931.1 hypothetical protein E3D44_19220 [Burkholderia cepacia]